MPPSPSSSSAPQPLQPGDYYVEGGLFVFTAQYLLRRGTCCDSGCRHCPYRGGGVAAKPPTRETPHDEGRGGPPKSRA